MALGIATGILYPAASGRAGKVGPSLTAQKSARKIAQEWGSGLDNVGQKMTMTAAPKTPEGAPRTIQLGESANDDDISSASTAFVVFITNTKFEDMFGNTTLRNAVRWV